MQNNEQIFIDTINKLITDKLIEKKLYLYIKSVIGYKMSLINLPDNYLSNNQHINTLIDSIYNNNIVNTFVSNYYNSSNLIYDEYKKMDNENKLLFEIKLIVKINDIIYNAKNNNTYNILCSKLNTDNIDIDNLMKSNIESLINIANNYHQKIEKYNYCIII